MLFVTTKENLFVVTKKYACRYKSFAPPCFFHLISLFYSSTSLPFGLFLTSSFKSSFYLHTFPFFFYFITVGRLKTWCSLLQTFLPTWFFCIYWKINLTCYIQEITMIIRIKELIRLKIIILFTSKWCAIYTFHEDDISTEIVKLF